MNHDIVQADHAGTVVEILVDDGKPVSVDTVHLLLFFFFFFSFWFNVFKLLEELLNVSAFVIADFIFKLTRDHLNRNVVMWT